MSWEDIIKAPYDYKKRKKAEKDLASAKRRIEETEPKEDFSTDISTFASEYLDTQFKLYKEVAWLDKRNRFPKEAVDKFTGLIKKYGKKELEDELGELYNTRVFITHTKNIRDNDMYTIELEKKQRF